jgi:uncharacterized protein
VSIEQLSGQEARWLALEGQGLGLRRPARPTPEHVLGAIAAVGALQLDAINVVERTQFLSLFARVGTYQRSILKDLSGPFGRLYETPGFLAELVSMDLQPLFRPGVVRGHSLDTPRRREVQDAYLDANRDYIDMVLRQVEVEGPLTAAQLEDPRRRSGSWWGRRSDGRRALEYLFRRGDVSAWRTETFERVYDLTERVVPSKVLSQPTPPMDEAHRQLLLLGAASLGVGTARDLADYHLVKPQRAVPRLRELVDGGALTLVEVEGWSEIGYVTPGVNPKKPVRAHATLLPPFDPIRRGHRTRLSRLFAFEHLIEVYVPGPKRRYGYYVFPVLLGDQLVARVDLKADRKNSSLQVLGVWSEPGHPASEIAVPIRHELDRLRRWLHLSDLTIRPNGDLAPALR